MCGICGQFRFDGEFVSTKSLDDMMSKLARRGPE
jgi:asparagine synthase (glutamine-hydrolysing)